MRWLKPDTILNSFWLQMKMPPSKTSWILWKPAVFRKESRWYDNQVMLSWRLKFDEPPICCHHTSRGLYSGFGTTWNIFSVNCESKLDSDTPLTLFLTIDINFMLCLIKINKIDQKSQIQYCINSGMRNRHIHNMSFDILSNYYVCLWCIIFILDACIIHLKDKWYMHPKDEHRSEHDKWTT